MEGLEYIHIVMAIIVTKEGKQNYIGDNMFNRGKLIYLIILISIIFSASVYAFDTMPLYTDWYYNDDWTKVTVDGRTYDNYVITWREFDKIRVCNTSSMYLVSPDFQREYTPDTFFNRRIVEGVRIILSGIRNNFPDMELLYINGEPWQDSEFRDYNFRCFQAYEHIAIDDYMLHDFLWDPDNNGYAEEVLLKNRSISEAKRRFSINELPVVLFSCDTYKDYKDYVLDDGQALEEIRFASYRDYLYGIPENAHVEPVAPVEREIYTTVVLHIDDAEIDIIKNGFSESDVLDIPPHSINGTTLIPIRGIIDTFGADIIWHGDTKQVEINKDGVNISLKIDSNIAFVNGIDVPLSESAQVVDGRTLIPLRFVSENLGCDVLWYEGGKIIISKAYYTSN